MPDLLLALTHLVQHRHFQLSSAAGGAQQIPVGQQFEEYCKDWLSLLPPGNVQNRQQHYRAAFVYEGGANNPPDAMYFGGNLGDAFEFKKTESLSLAAIPLNSSFPKDKLYRSSPAINNACRNCEPWTSRDLYYVIGAVPRRSQRVKSLWVVEGRLLAADHATYQNFFDSIKNSVRSQASALGATSLGRSKELARLADIDPLHRTKMRTRSMWELSSPRQAFRDLEGVRETSQASPVSTLHALVTEVKWLSFAASSQNALAGLAGTAGFSISRGLLLPDPNYPANSIPSVLVRFES